MIIKHNIEAGFTNISLGNTNKTLAKSTEKLSSGYRVNRAADDAAGLAISEEMRAQIRGLNRGAQNTSEAIQFCQVADGAMQELENIIHRIRELAVQAENDTNTKEDRMDIQHEIDGLINEVDRITDDTEYNTIKVFGKSRMCTTYEMTNGTKLVPVETKVVEVTNSNYGITEVLGTDNVYQGNKMDSIIEFTGTGWHNTGITVQVSSDVINSLNTQYGISVLATSQNASEILTSSDGKSTITLNYDLFRANGDRILTGYSVSTYDTNVNDPDKVLVESKTENIKLEIEGTSGAGTTTKYGSAWLDFSGLGTDYTVESLYGQAFNTVCGHGCGCHYNIIFTDETGNKTTADGTNYTYETSHGHQIIKLNISDCTTGEDIVKKIMSAASEETDFIDHWNQFAYNDNEPAKLYIYDSQAGYTSDTFQPISWTGSSSSVQTVVTWIEVPNTTTYYKWEDYDMHIQVGSNTDQMVQLKRPYLNADILGITDLNVVDREEGGVSIRGSVIELCDFALNTLNEWRSHIGALANRFEHVYDIDLNSSENIQVSESKIRDVDMADEMVKFSSSSIIQQAAQAMLAQTNRSKDGILALLS